MKKSDLRSKMIVSTVIIGIMLFAVNSFAQFGGGDGTAENPYQIENAEHLNQIRNHLDAHFIQTANISLDEAPWNEGTGWSPIGSPNQPFCGTYDGRNSIINGLTINGHGQHTGLFGHIENALLESMVLENVDIAGGLFRSGTIAGACVNSRIINCSASGIVSISSGNQTSAFVGALWEGSTLSNCWVDAEITTDGGWSGGMVGTNAGSLIENCYVLGSITSTVRNNQNVGGFLGMLSGGTITNCYTRSIVTTDESCNRVGGFVGRNENGTITNSYSTGRVTGGGESAGGFVGGAVEGTTTNCYWDIDTSEIETSFGGEGRNASQMVRRVTYADADWEFPDVWNIVEEETYPFLAWEDGPSIHNKPGPFGLTADDDIIAREIALEWDMIGNPSHYNVYRDNEFLRSVNHPTRELVDRNLDYLVGYTYYVEAVFVEGEEELVTIHSNPVAVILFPFAGGDGSADNPYQVADGSQLYVVRYLLDAHFIQIADINLDVAPWNEGQGWEPISNDTNQFIGTYDGGGYVIKGLTINRNATHQGLFGYGNGATVTGVRLEDVNVTGSHYTGALFGYTTNTTIRNCGVEGSVKGTYFLGGITGYMSGGSIAGCYVAGEVIVPGISADGYIGGIAGYFTGITNITNCYSTAMVQGNQTKIGGLVGYKTGANSVISNSYCTGVVIANNETEHVGGLVGQHVSGVVNNCLWNTETTGREISPGGGTGTGTSQMVRRGTFQDANWEFPNVWDIAEGETYPFLAWENGPSFHNKPGPSRLTADGDIVAREIALEWDMIGNPTRYNVYRDNEFLRSVNHPTRELVDSNLERLVEYTYYVEAVFVEGEEEIVTTHSNHVAVILFPFAGGDGSVDNPYQVANESQLNMVRHLLDAHFIQTANISLDEAPWNEGTGWSPIGSPNQPFCGTYDGRNFVINGLTINGHGQYTGLFGHIEDALLKNMVLENVDITGGAYRSGSLAAVCFNSRIINCNATGIVSVGGGNQTSAFIGALYEGSTLLNCWVDAEITTTGSWSGGMTGTNIDSVIENCYVLGSITSTVAGNQNVGGFLGMLSGGTITNCYTRSIVTTNDSCNRVGGFVGRNENGTITNCYSTGRVTGGGGSAGGFVGGATEGTANQCYWDTETSQMIISFAGEGRMTRQMTYPYDLDTTYEQWDFDEIWTHDQDGTVNNGYPILYYQEVVPPLDPPEVTIDIIEIDGVENIRLRWELVEDALSYRIYSSPIPMTEDWGEPISVVGEEVTEYREPLSDTRTKFYYVTASYEPNRSGRVGNRRKQEIARNIEKQRDDKSSFSFENYDEEGKRIKAIK